MSRAIAVLLGTLALTAGIGCASKPAQDPSSTSVTSAPSKANHGAKLPVDPSEEREENGDSLRN